MRLFLAIYPPKEFLDYFRDVRRALDKEKRNMRFIEPEQIHLTAKFIGSKVNSPSKNAISSELQRHAGSYPKPTLTIEGVSLGFPRQHDPRVVMANISPEYDLEELTEVLHKQIRSLKRRDTIRWKQRNEADFHISLGRLKPAATKSAGREVKELIKEINLPIPEPFKPTEMYLVASEITPRGPKYKKLESIRL